MHGIIILAIKKYAESKFGLDVWPSLLASAGIPDKLFLPVQEYDDAEAIGIVMAASAVTGMGPQEILRDFGKFMVPDLVGIYRTLIDKRWRALDLLENTERVIHRVVRIRNPGARPPELKVTRVSPYEVVIVYQSHRKMCPLALGIIEGVADYYGEKVSLFESTCMLHGASSCTIQVTTAATATPAR